MIRDYCKTIKTGNPRDCKARATLKGSSWGQFPWKPTGKPFERQRFVAWHENSLSTHGLHFGDTNYFYRPSREGRFSGGETARTFYFVRKHSRECGWWVIVIGRCEFSLRFACLGGVGPGRNERAPWYDTLVFWRKMWRKRQKTWSCIVYRNLTLLDLEFRPHRLPHRSLPRVYFIFFFSIR